jgi:hypothetical protein
LLRHSLFFAPLWLTGVKFPGLLRRLHRIPKWNNDGISAGRFRESMAAILDEADLGWVMILLELDLTRLLLRLTLPGTDVLVRVTTGPRESA